MFESLGKMNLEMEKLRKAAQAQIKPALQEALKDLQNAVPDVEAVRWQQYTPYFNDGDTCEFSVHDPEVKFKGDADFTSSWDLDSDKLSKTQLEVIGNFGEELRDAEDALKAAFGDHAQVTVDPSGIETEAYEHD
jgi:hypothetical protein